MYLLRTVVIAVVIFRSAGETIELCPLGYAVLVPCCTTPKHLSSDTSDVYCPSGCLSKNLSVWGTDIYTEDTPICLAAIHAGIVSNGGGYIMVQKMPGQDKYTGSIRNGIISLNHGISNASFTFPSSSIKSITATTTPTIAATTAISPSTTTPGKNLISTAVTTPSTISASTTPATTTGTPRTTTPSINLTSTTFLISSTLTNVATTIAAVNIGLISCHTYLDMLQGDPLMILCPANCISTYVWGTDIYTSDSDLCPSAIHAGVITSKGGYVTVKREPLQNQYIGSYRNGIQSSSSTSIFVLESFRFL